MFVIHFWDIYNTHLVGKLSLQWLNLSTEFHYLTEWKSVQGYSQSARQRGKMPLVNYENKVFISPNSPLLVLQDIVFFPSSSFHHVTTWFVYILSTHPFFPQLSSLFWHWGMLSWPRPLLHTPNNNVYSCVLSSRSLYHLVVISILTLSCVLSSRD